MHLIPPPSRPLRGWQAAALPLCLDAIAARIAGVIVACTGSGKSVLLAEVIAAILPQLEGAIVVSTSSQRLVKQLTETIGDRIGPGNVGSFYAKVKEIDRPVIVTTNDSCPTVASHLQKLGRSVVLWVADECHRTETGEMHRAWKALNAESRLGFTATPFRSLKSQRVQLFDKVLVKYTPGDALRDKVIVPWRVLPWSGPESKLDDAILEMIQEYGVGPGVVNASSISDARDFAARLTEAGIPASTVHSELSERDQETRLGMLRDGELRVLVYPSLLSEGADFPWLRWMCLRRKVGARVRFIQEVGRVLRTFPGKESATILDPRNLFNELSLSYEHLLGWDVAEDGPEEPEVEVEEEKPEENPAGDQLALLDTTMVKPLAQLETWARQLFLAAQTEGLIQNARVQSSEFRARLPSSQQFKALHKFVWVWNFLPREHKIAMSKVVPNHAIPSSGVASDLLDVCIALANRKASWTPILPVFSPPENTIKAAHEEMTAGDWYAAGVVQGGAVAISVVHGKRVMHLKQWMSDSAVPLAAHVAAARYAAGLADGKTIYLSDPVAIQLLRGEFRSHNEAVVKAMRLGQAPAAVAMIEQRNNPATAIAWREAKRLQNLASKGA